MNQVMVNKQGYFLVEMILVLFLIGSILTIIPKVTSPNSSEIVAKFVENLDRQLTVKKFLSSTNLTLYKLSFEADHYTIGKVTTEIEVYPYDPRLTVVIKGVRSTDIYQGSTVSQIVLFVTCDKQTYQITITEKSGLIDVIKQ